MSASSSASSKPSVAIIGGGIAGLSCAAELQRLGKYNPTVFDTGRIRPGGRCSSRFAKDEPKEKGRNRDSILSRYTIDHAAQILTLPRNGFEDFKNQVKIWSGEEKNEQSDIILKKYPRGSVVEIVSDDFDRNKKKGDGKQQKKEKSTPTIRSVNSQYMYYSPKGIGSIPLAIANENNLKIEQDVWISPSNGVKYIGSKDSNYPQWSVQTNGKRFGNFDCVIVAHNGKCADRLMSRTPAKDLHSLLQVNFSPYVPQWGGKKMTLNSIYSLTVAIKSQNGQNLSDFVGKDVMVGFVKNEPDLRFITNQGKKIQDKKLDHDLEIWTILSSAKFAKKYKGPQENLPNERVEEVTKLMLEGLERSLGLQEGWIHRGLILDSKLQLWGAAVPMNVWNPSGDLNESNSGFLFDAQHGVGTCGDWLLDPSIPGAYESGRRLARYMSSSGDKEDIGLPSLGGEFRQSRAASGAGIGNVR